MENIKEPFNNMQIGQMKAGKEIAPQVTSVVPNQSALSHTMHSYNVPYTTEGTAFYLFADTADMTVSIRMQPDTGKYEMDDEFIASMEQVDIPAGDKLNQLVEFLKASQEMFSKEGVV